MVCAIYCRLSREDEEKTGESESIQNQKSMLIHYAAEQGWDIWQVYCDEDYSGVDRERPGWNAMLEAAEQRRFQIILCKTQSRFTRDMELVERYIHGLFPLWGIRFVSVVDHTDTENRGNKKARQISGLINEWYLEDLSDNVRAVFEQKRRTGQYIGSFAPYGYRKDPADHNHLIIDEAAAETVRLIFRLFLGGAGVGQIAGILNGRGIMSPAGYRRSRSPSPPAQAQINASGLWSHTAVGRILRNEVYIGTTVQGIRRKASYKSKQLLSVPPEEWIRVAGTHEPVVERGDFDEVQRQIGRKNRQDGAGRVHPLAGLVRCLDCGSAMKRLTTTYRGAAKSYLECGRYASSRKAPACTKHTIRLEGLTRLIEERILSHLSAYCGADLKSSPAPPCALQGQAAERELDSLRQRRAALAAAMKTLYLDRSGGLITDQEFLELFGSLRADREACSRRIAELESRPADNAACKGPPAAAPFQVSRELIRRMVKSIEIGERDPEANRQRVVIHWNF